MTSSLLDISGKLEPSLLAAISTVSRVAEGNGIQLLIVGATARDILLGHNSGIAARRATNDVDFGVLVDSWDQYEVLATSLISSEGFQRHRTARHKFTAGNGVMVNLIPFGGLANDRGEIYWPADGARMMSIVGFGEVLQGSTTVLLQKNPDLIVKVASLPGLALLKLISWNDAYPERARDAGDFFLIVNNYIEAGNLDRLGSDARDLVLDPPSPLGIIGARLLGRDMKHVASEPTLEVLGRILEVETDEQGPLRLLGDIRPSAGPTTSDDEIFALLSAVREGLMMP